MTAEQARNLSDDIAFMRALAQEGRQTPLLGGAILVATGIIFAAASLFQWAVMTQVLALSVWALPIGWTVALGVFFIAMTVIRRRMGVKPGAASPANRGMKVAWSAVGWSIFVIALCMWIVCWRSHSTIVMAIFPSIILALYGLGWSIPAAMTGKRWLWMTAVGSYFAALVLAVLGLDPVAYLVYAAALILLATVPGLLLMRQEPSDIV